VDVNWLVSNDLHEMLKVTATINKTIFVF